MKIIFFGSDNFAAVHLQSLIKSRHEVVACVTQPDRPKGRGMKVHISEIKECARVHRIPILQPSSLRENNFHASSLGAIRLSHTGHNFMP